MSEREFSVDEDLKKTLSKLLKKDRETYEMAMEKMKEIINCENVEHYKNLRKPLQHLKRVHVRKSFVLTFRHEKNEDKIVFYKFEHHDKIYRE